MADFVIRDLAMFVVMFGWLIAEGFGVE
jgi:hypothetical protein